MKDFDTPELGLQEQVKQHEISLDDLAKHALMAALDNGHDMVDVENPETHAEEAYEAYAFNIAEWVIEDVNQFWDDPDEFEYDLPELKSRVTARITDEYLDAPEDQ